MELPPLFMFRLSGVHQHPQVLLDGAALDLFIPQPWLIPGFALTKVQHLTLGHVKPHDIPMEPLLGPVQVPWAGIPPFGCADEHSLAFSAGLLRVHTIP